MGHMPVPKQPFQHLAIVYVDMIKPINDRRSLKTFNVLAVFIIHNLNGWLNEWMVC